MNACPCQSGKSYQECCGRYHSGQRAESALALMRSRYTAYARRLADYIIHTTHPSHPSYRSDLPKWRREILDFSEKTTFKGLKILEVVGGKEEAYVTFTALLEQEGKDVSFTEKSHFVKVDGHWLYREAVLRRIP